MLLYEKIFSEFKKEYPELEPSMIEDCDLLILANFLCLVNEDHETQFLVKTKDTDLLFELLITFRGNTSIPMSKIIEGRYE